MAGSQVPLGKKGGTEGTKRRVRLLGTDRFAPVQPGKMWMDGQCGVGLLAHPTHASGQPSPSPAPSAGFLGSLCSVMLPKFRDTRCVYGYGGRRADGPLLLIAMWRACSRASFPLVLSRLSPPPLFSFYRSATPTPTASFLMHKVAGGEGCVCVSGWCHGAPSDWAFWHPVLVLAPGPPH